MKKYIIPLLWIIIIVFVFVGASFFYNANKSENLIQKETVPTDKGTSTNDTQEQIATRPLAPEITLKDMDGNTVNLSDFRGKVVILNFWASWCPPCKEEMPELEAASQAFEQREEAVLLTINLTDGVRETIEKGTQYIDDNNFTLKVLFDIDSTAAINYGIQSIPTTFIIDKTGRVYESIIGPTTKDALVNYVSVLKDEITTAEYKKISPSDAKDQLATDPSIFLLDVRTLEEYNEKHIPKSTLVPLDQLESDPSKKLPEKSATIFVYCRSGNRSATASNLLLDMGYTNVYDLGGIQDWPYETETGN